VKASIECGDKVFDFGVVKADCPGPYLFQEPLHLDLGSVDQFCQVRKGDLDGGLAISWEWGAVVGPDHDGWSQVLDPGSRIMA
jgi:hypothetical protein